MHPYYCEIKHTNGKYTVAGLRADDDQAAAEKVRKWFVEDGHDAGSIVSVTVERTVFK